MVSCDVACHVMSCHLMWWSCDLMRCECLRCVMSRDTMRCHGDELLSAVPSNGMECSELKMPLTSVCGSKWFCDDVVIQSTTPYYKEPLQYYSVPVLQSSTHD